VRTLTSSFNEPIDVVPISIVPSKELIPFGKEYVIPDDTDEENPSAASSEQLDEEIEVEDIISTPLVSSHVSQFTAEEASVEEIDEDVDIGSTTPVLNDDYWENLHPNSPIATPLRPIPLSPVPTEEILTGSEGHQTYLQSIPEEIPAATAEEMETQTADETTASIPQSAVPEVVTQEVVRPATENLQPKTQSPHTKRPKFKAGDFFDEHHFFTNANPYDSARLGRKRFWTASQMNFYASVLFEGQGISTPSNSSRGYGVHSVLPTSSQCSS
jgi:hypothetical protein